MKSLDRLKDERLDDPDEAAPDSALADELAGRIADLLSDPAASDSTITLLESYSAQLADRGWLSERQQEIVEQIENRRMMLGGHRRTF